MAKHKSTFVDDHRQAAILIAMLMNEMALADRYESLREVAEIKPALVGSYARYAAAALQAQSRYSKLPREEQRTDTFVFIASDALAATDGIVPVNKKHILYAKAAHAALQAFGNIV